MCSRYSEMEECPHICMYVDVVVEEKELLDEGKGV